MSIKRRLLRGGMSMLALRLYSMGLMFAINSCLARWMTQTEFSTYLVGSNLLLLVSLIGMSGINQSMIRLVVGKKRSDIPTAALMRRCWIAASLFSLVVTAIFAILLRTILGAWLQCPPQIIAAILVCALLTSAHKLLASSLRSLHSVATSSVMEGRSGGPLANSAFFPVAWVLSFAGLNAATCLWGFAVALLITLPIGFWLLKKALPDPNRDDSNDEVTIAVGGVETQNVWLFSLPFLLTQVLHYFTTEFDVLLAQAYTNQQDTALFGSARRLVMQAIAPMTILATTVNSSIAELYAKGDRDGLQRLLGHSSIIGCAVTVPLMLLCVFFAAPILGLVYGPAYRDGATVLAIASIGQLFVCATGQCGMLLSLSGRTSYLLAQRFVFAVLLVLVGILMVKSYGITGLAVATTMVIALESVVMWIAAKTLVGYWTHPSWHGSKPALKETLSA